MPGAGPSEAAGAIIPCFEYEEASRAPIGQQHVKLNAGIYRKTKEVSDTKTERSWLHGRGNVEAARFGKRLRKV